jgi:tetratricopeptide (TPR) repeat protein
MPQHADVKVGSVSCLIRFCVSGLVEVLLLLATLLLVAPLAFAGTNAKKPLVVDPNTQEGFLLELIQAESNPATKLLLLERFVRQFPTSESLYAVYTDMQSQYMESIQYDKAIGAGENALAIDTQDIECARRNLEVARQKRDPALIAKWNERIQKIAEALSSSPLPKSPDDVPAWQARVDLARQLLGSEEYALYKQAFDAADPRRKIELLGQLERQYPDGVYARQAPLLYFVGYRQLGDSKKAFTVAERILERDQTHEDVLLMVADTLFRSKADSARVLVYSNKILGLMSSKPKPAGLSDAEWGRQKATYSGTAYSMIGGVYLNEEHYVPADRTLRLALPLLQGQGRELQRAATLSYLGWANYKMRNYAEATRFYTQCMAISGSYQESAIRNLSVIKSEEEQEKQALQ